MIRGWSRGQLCHPMPGFQLSHGSVSDPLWVWVTFCGLPMAAGYLRRVIRGNTDLAGSDPGDL